MESSLQWVAGTATPRKVYLTRVWNFGTWDEWRAMADVCMVEQRWADAERALLRLLELDPNHAAGRNNLEAVRRQLGQ